MTKRAFAQILEKRPECTDEFENVRKLDNDLSIAIESVRKGRQGLLEARKKFTGKFNQKPKLFLKIRILEEIQNVTAIVE